MQIDLVNPLVHFLQNNIDKISMHSLPTNLQTTQNSSHSSEKINYENEAEIFCFLYSGIA